MKHAWYSAQQAARWGTVAWFKEDETEVVVTEVSDSDTCPAKWEDIEYLGVVVKYSRQISKGSKEVFSKRLK